MRPQDMPLRLAAVADLEPLDIGICGKDIIKNCLDFPYKGGFGYDPEEREFKEFLSEKGIEYLLDLGFRPTYIVMGGNSKKWLDADPIKLSTELSNICYRYVAHCLPDRPLDIQIISSMSGLKEQRTIRRDNGEKPIRVIIYNTYGKTESQRAFNDNVLDIAEKGKTLRKSGAHIQDVVDYSTPGLFARKELSDSYPLLVNRIKTLIEYRINDNKRENPSFFKSKFETTYSRYVKEFKERGRAEPASPDSNEIGYITGKYIFPVGVGCKK